MTNQATKPIRIAILLGTIFTEQNFERVGIPYLSPYFEVMVFDCLYWLGRNADEIKCQKVHWEYYTTIKTELDLEIAIKEYKPSYAIDFIGLSIYTAKIQNILAKFNVKFVMQKTGNLPAPGLINRIKRFFGQKEWIKQERGEILSLASNCDNKKWIHFKKGGYFINKFAGKMKQFIAIRKNISPPDISLLAGNKSLDSFSKNSSHIIWIGSHDFHHFNKAKMDLKASKILYRKESFILFIDDCMPSASDWKLLNIKPPVTATTYYLALRSFFERIESHYGLPVVIAGHPSAQSDDSYASNFGGRNVIFGETASLVLQSTLVLIHGSTATSFAVLAPKPILFLTTRELDESHFGLHVRTMAKSLGSPLVFMDEADSLVFSSYSLAINVKKYKLYETNYLRNEISQETRPWQAFIDYVLTRSRRSCQCDVTHLPS